jgi:hypothetical protein
MPRPHSPADETAPGGRAQSALNEFRVTYLGSEMRREPYSTAHRPKIAKRRVRRAGGPCGPDQFKDMGGPETPFHDTAIVKVLADLLSDEDTVERICVADTADCEY